MATADVVFTSSFGPNEFLKMMANGCVDRLLKIYGPNANGMFIVNIEFRPNGCIEDDD